MAGEPSDVWVECPFFFWAIRLEPVGSISPQVVARAKNGYGDIGRWVLVDSGIQRPETAAGAAVSRHVPTLELLKNAGVDPAQISDVIITHLHWDHVDGLAAIVAARNSNVSVWLDNRELDWARDLFSGIVNGCPAPDDSPEESGTSPCTVLGVRRQDLELFLMLHDQGQLHLIEGSWAPEVVADAPGIMVISSPGHTPGNLAVMVSPSSAPPFLFTSDAAYLGENLTRTIPPGTVHSTAQAMDTISRLVMFSESHPGIVFIPGHDPAVATSYPAMGIGVLRLYP